MPLEGELPPSSNIEGYFLAKCVPRFVSADSITTNFWFMFKKFLEANNFVYDEKINLGPFSDRSPEKTWYRPVRFEVNHPKERTQHKSNRVWEKFLSEQLLPIGFRQHPKERFEVRLHAPHLMARQLGFAQANPAPLSMIEAEQAHQLKINSLDSLLAAPFDSINARADKLLAEDQPQRPKPAPNRKPDPSEPSKKTTKTPHPEPSNVQSDASSGTKILEGNIPPPKAFDMKEAKPAPLPTYSVSSDSASTHSKQISPISRRPKSPEGIEKDSHVSSSDTNTEIGPQLDTAEKTKSSPKPTSSHDSGDFLLDIESLVAELHKAASETVIEKAGDSESLNKSVQQEVKKSIKEPIIERPPTPVNQYNISAEVLNALRWLIDLLNASLEQDVDHEMVQQKAEPVTSHFRKHFVPEEAAPVEGVPLLVKNLVNTASNLKKCQNWVIDLGKDLKLLDKTTSDYDKVKSQLGTEVESANDKLSGLNQQKTKLEKELASIQRQIKEVEDQKEKLEAPLNRSKQGLKKIDDKLTSIASQKKTTQEQLAELKQAEKDELELHEKFLESQRSTRMALEDILHEYTS
ncbi:hypothetical protein PIB30_092733 [Stylosanthes scabra]|uniref:Uncharacterized protein n=1 Tax=Stylosanthes scabra TaxID=79078 RepID=A0ABU6QUE0_9FABA|nr:hypothetical protein [Stylosanthes scabra]